MTLVGQFTVYDRWMLAYDAKNGEEASERLLRALLADYPNQVRLAYDSGTPAAVRVIFTESLRAEVTQRLMPLVLTYFHHARSA